jgi:hypothetical protein
MRKWDIEQSKEQTGTLLEVRIDIPKHGLQAFFFDPGLD